MRQASAARPHQGRLLMRLRLVCSSACRATAIIGAAIDRKTERVVSSIHRQVAEDPGDIAPFMESPKIRGGHHCEGTISATRNFAEFARHRRMRFGEAE